MACRLVVCDNLGVPIDLAALPDDPGILRELVSHAELENAGLRAEIDKLHLLIAKLRRHRFGQRSEQLDPDQLALALEDLEQAEAAGDEAAQAGAAAGQTRERKRRQRNLGALPDSLPEIEVVVDLEERECSCCGRSTIGSSRM